MKMPKCYDRTASFHIAMNIHKHVGMIVDKLISFGFVFDGWNNKEDSFTVAYPQKPLFFDILQTYATAIDDTVQTAASYSKFASFSYRWIEDPAEQKYEPLFLVQMDMASKKLQKIGYWLYDKAKEYGFTIDQKKPFDKGCIHYTKGSKSFLLVGERYVDEKPLIFSKAIFRQLQTANPELFSELCHAFPNTFGANGKSFDNPSLCGHCNTECSMRISYDLDGKTYNNCAYQSFYFYDLNLDNIKVLTEAYCFEHKIRVV